MTSEWRPIDGAGGRYEVSRSGLVRVTPNGRLLKQWENDQGYMLVRLSKPRRVARVHRLVAAAFVPNPEGKPFVNHIDCVRSHNVATNLEWCTQLENLRHSDRLGRMQKDYWKGRRSPFASLSDDAVRRIRALYATGLWSWESLGREVGMSKRAIGRLVTRETYANV